MALVIEDGTYRAKGVQGALGETKAGREQVAVECVLLDADGVEGQHITWFGHFTEKTTEHTIKALRTFGWMGADLTDLSGIDTNEVSLVIENETGDDGRTRPRVRWVNPPAGSGIGLKAPLAADKAKAFAAKMKGTILALDKGATVKPAAKPKAKSNGMPPPEPPPHDDADMPF